MATKDYILGNNPPKGSKAWNEKDESVQYPKGTQQWTESASTEDNKDSKQKSTPEKSETDNIRTPLDVVKNNPKFQNVAENAYKKVINPEQQEKSVTKVVSDSENKAQPRYNWRDKPEHDNEVYKTSIHRYGNGEVGYKALQQQAKDNEDQYNHENNDPNSKQQEKKTEKKEQVKSQTPYESISGNQAIQKVAENAYKKVINPEQQEKKVSTYSELLEELYPKPDSERLKEDAKRARTRNVIAALGDGISALANLYYTTKGAPNMLDGKNTLSAKSQARYDKLIQDYKDNLEKYRQGRLKAEQLDKEWNYRAERDKVGDEQWNKSHQLGLDKFEYQKGRDKVGDDRYAAEQEHRAKREDKADEQQEKDNEFKQQQFDENKRQFNIREGRSKTRNKSTSKKKNENSEKIIFINKDGNTISIDKKLWDDNYAEIFDAYQEKMAFDRLKPITWSSTKTDNNGKLLLDSRNAKEIMSKDWYDSPSFVEYLQNISKQSASDDYEYEYDENEKITDYDPNDEFNKEYNNSDNDNTAPYLK